MSFELAEFVLLGVVDADDGVSLEQPVAVRIAAVSKTAVIVTVFFFIKL
jgi:hypothetical protein